MAKPIRFIPELSGSEADSFLRRMIELESFKVNLRQKKFAKEIERNMKLLVVA